MRRSLPSLVVMLALLALPFAARPRRESETAGAVESLVVLTPHNGAIRYELGRAFVAHMALRGRKVQLDWRSPGGTTEITRYLIGEYASAFERYWTGTLHRAWSPTVAASFATAGDVHRESTPADTEATAARRAFLESNVGCGIDLLFGGGSVEAGLHAAAGRLVDAGVVARHPELFGDTAIPEMVGGEPFWDRAGRWVGTCLSGFGICFNHDALARLGVANPPASWSDLANPVYLGQLGLADPGKSGSIAKAFEMLIQQQMQEQLQAQLQQEARRLAVGSTTTETTATAAPDLAKEEGIATRAGWQAAMRLIRRISANARYFSDVAARVPIDVATGDAAAGMCIDFYAHFQSQIANAAGGRPRMGFTMPRAGSSLVADAIGLLRGAPHRALAVEFMEFVLSEAGQKVWSFRVGAPGGPTRYSLERLPMMPALYAAKYDAYRADPATQPYAQAPDFIYHPEWTAPLFRAISFVVRVMCVEPAPELEAAYRALAAARFPARATALFDDVSAVDYDTVRGPLRAALRAPSALDEVAWTNRLVRQFREQYREVARLAKAEANPNAQ